MILAQSEYWQPQAAEALDLLELHEAVQVLPCPASERSATLLDYENTASVAF